MKRIISIIFIITLLFAGGSFAKKPLTTDAFAEYYDTSNYFSTLEYKAKMTIRYKDGTVKEKIYKAYFIGEDKALIKVIVPSADSKVRLLKLGKEMYLYMPKLKQGVLLDENARKKPFLGSDLTYEDIVTNEMITGKYDIDIVTKDRYKRKHRCVVIELTSRDDDRDYYQQILMVNTPYYFPWEKLYFSKDGKLLKKFTTLEHKLVRPDAKHPATKYEVDDMSRSDTVTTIEIFFMKHSHEISEDYFTLEYLKQ